MLCTIVDVLDCGKPRPPASSAIVTPRCIESQYSRICSVRSDDLTLTSVDFPERVGGKDRSPNHHIDDIKYLIDDQARLLFARGNKKRGNPVDRSAENL